MINEETSNKTLHMELQAAKLSAKGIEKLVKDLLHKLDQQKQMLIFLRSMCITKVVT